MNASIEVATTRGRTRITERAMSRLVSAVTADTLGVRPDQVTVDLADASGRLDLSMQAPIRVRPLERGDGPAPMEGTILDRTERAQHDIRNIVTELTGAQISGVTVRLTGAHIRVPKRVD